MTALAAMGHAAAFLVLPVLLLGLLTRVRALWSGRRGAGFLQPAFDLVRLARKIPVYSTTTTALFRFAPLVVLAAVGVSALFVPVLGGAVAAVSFPFDFVVLVYCWGLGRTALVLGAMDTGSAFEGMGASREASWGALSEPALLFGLGALALVTGQTSLAQLIHPAVDTPLVWAVRLCAAACLLIVLQLEASRVPIEDPATHLELTMVHEVMVLDHSGPDLAMLQLASGLKLAIGASLVAALVTPWVGVAAQLGGVAVVTVAVGCIEALTARLKLSAVPTYLALASALGFLALLLASWAVAQR